MRGNVLLVCDRAVCRVLMGYFDAKAHTELESLPHIKVDPGVIELRRSHSGFSCTHHSISAGAASTAAGPGTSLEGQTANIPVRFASTISAPAGVGLGGGIPRMNTSPS